MSVHSVDSIRPIYSSGSSQRLIWVGFPIRKSPDLRLFAPTRGLSQLITSFIVSMCLGILRTPLVALPKCCSWRWLGYIESPDWVIQSFQFPNCQKTKFCAVELTGIEPATSWMQIRRSSSWATAPHFRNASQSSVRSNVLEAKNTICAFSKNYFVWSNDGSIRSSKLASKIRSTWFSTRENLSP